MSVCCVPRDLFVVMTRLMEPLLFIFSRDKNKCFGVLSAQSVEYCSLLISYISISSFLAVDFYSINYGQGSNEGFSEIYREVKTLTPPPFPTFWMVKKNILSYFKLFSLTISITYRNNLPYILLSLFRFSPTNQTISDSSSLVFLLNGRLDFNRGVMEFQLLFLFSFVLGSVFYEDKVSSLNEFEGVFAQKRSFVKATYHRYA